MKLDSLKDKIEKNPIISLIILVFICTSVVATILLFFYNKEIELITKQKDNELIETKSKLSSIKRNIYSNEYFDIRQLFITNEEIKNIPDNYVFFDDDQFYAPKNIGELKYKKMNYVELKSRDEGKEAPELLKIFYSKMFVHMWTLDNDVIIDGINGIRVITPCIKLQKRSKFEFKGMLGALFQKLNIAEVLNKYLEKGEINDGRFDTAKISKNLEGVYNGNWSAILLEQYLTKGLSLPVNNSNVMFELLNVNKNGNAIYAQGLTTFSDVNVNNFKYKKYYLREELIIMSNMNTIYIINTLMPSKDPSTRDPIYKDISNWLYNVKILINS